MILIVRSFAKELAAFDKNIKSELITLISKHARWLSKSFIFLRENGNLLVYKGYLNGNRVRIVVAKTQKWTYIPLEILKKESRDGYNIRNNYDASDPIERIEWEIAKDLYEIWDLEA